MSDNSEVRFTDWEEKNPSTDQNRACVEMKSHFGFYSTETSVGKWTDVLCNKKNIVLCQKIQSWSISYMQKKFMNAMKDFSGAINELKASINQLNKELLPNGFIYVQLPNQRSPQEVWSSMKWNDISQQYSNVFFRVIRGIAEAFDKFQEETE